MQNDIAEGRFDRMAFYAFDLLYLDGDDVREAPLTERAFSRLSVPKAPAQFGCFADNFFRRAAEEIGNLMCAVTPFDEKPQIRQVKRRPNLIAVEILGSA